MKLFKIHHENYRTTSAENVLLSRLVTLKIFAILFLSLTLNMDLPLQEVYRSFRAMSLQLKTDECFPQNLRNNSFYIKQGNHSRLKACKTFTIFICEFTFVETADDKIMLKYGKLFKQNIF